MDIFEVINDVLESEDNTGCSEDLTVVSKKAIEDLRNLSHKLVKDRKQHMEQS